MYFGYLGVFCVRKLRVTNDDYSVALLDKLQGVPKRLVSDCNSGESLDKRNMLILCFMPRRQLLLHSYLFLMSSETGAVFSTKKKTLPAVAPCMHSVLWL